MAFQSMAADSGGSYEPLQLEPFIHQVGGHSSMLQLDEDTICKPLIPQERNFYKSASDSLREFMAEYKGSIEVTFSEADDGYLDLTTYLPPSYKRPRKPGTRQNSLTESERKIKHRDMQKYPPLKMNCYLPRIRLCQSGSIQIESIPLEDTKMKFEDLNHGKAQNGSALNPWVLHIHEKQMKKLQKSSSISQKYILLENRVSKYEFPCILDLKMGTRQYGDTMSQAKKQSHTAKAAASTSAILGVRISGMQVYHQESGHYTCHNKYYGRGLTVEGFQQALYNFLHDGVKLRFGVISALLDKLRKLYSVVQSLNTFRFFTSSLLIIYNGSEQCSNKSDASCEPIRTAPLADNGNVGKEKKLKETHSKSKDKCAVPSSTTFSRKHVPREMDRIGELPQPIVDLCMIDFAHSTHNAMPDCPVTHEGPDEGYLFGLENLITHLEVIQRTEK